MPGQIDRVLLNTSNVSVRNLILSVDRHRERFDRREVETIDFTQDVYWRLRFDRVRIER